MAVDEGTYSIQFLCVENNNSADRTVPNVLSLLRLSLSGEPFY